MKNYLDFEKEIKALEQEAENLRILLDQKEYPKWIQIK